MADWFVGPVMEKLIDACFDYLKNQVGWQTGLEEELKKLRAIHPQIQAVVSAYSHVEIKDPGLNKWLWQLRDAIDEADDVLDEFEYRHLEEQVRKNTRKRKAHLLEGPLEIGKRALKFGKRVLRIDPNLERLEAAVHKLYEVSAEVMSKRFLLVLDDIWEADEPKWKNVLAPLHYGSSGSKILITTRMDSVASMFAMMIKMSKHTLQLNGLEEDECLQLFNTHAFAGVENPDDKLRSIAEKMVNKLSRCPLAAKVIGGILNFNLDEPYWTKVLNTNIGNVEPGENELLPVLKLSYIYLPKYLQNCFAFCCIFPQDYEFDKDDLVRMWIALGFVQSSNIQGETIEDTGRRYFDILFRKSFFDKSCTKYYNKVCYKMHDLLHELAQFVSRQECLRVVNDEVLSITPETIRHLSIDSSSSTLIAAIKTGKFKNLHSLFLTSSNNFERNEIFEILKASKSIRLLSLHGQFAEWTLHEMFGCLIHLRYLKGEFLNHYEFPRSISHLYQLQFIHCWELKLLEMDNNAIPNLPNLNHLIVDTLIIKDPSVLLMETVRSISSFHSLKIEKNDELVSFRSEIEQWFMQHSSSIFGLTFAKLQSLQSLPSSLESLSSLKTLQVYDVPQLKLLPNPPSSLERLDLANLESVQCLPSCLPARTLDIRKVPLLLELPNLPASLNRVHIEGLESLQCLPSSFSAISSLNYLTLRNIPLLKSLPDLPSSLTELEIENLDSLQCLPSSLSAISFISFLEIKNNPLLKSLPDLPPSLRSLRLENLENLDCLPSSLSTISSLESLSLRRIGLLKSLPGLPSSLNQLYIELKSLQCLPSSLPAISSLNYLRLECYESTVKPHVIPEAKNKNKIRKRIKEQKEHKDFTWKPFREKTTEPHHQKNPLSKKKPELQNLPKSFGHTSSQKTLSQKL